ncbi:TPA: hypothetical protein DF272_03115 [Candidatus Falkowbacteria bacterium]|nr:hypothetical protein [Candidatus Falkowbacteria bacterium]
MAKPASMRAVFDLVQKYHSLRFKFKPGTLPWEEQTYLTRYLWVGKASIVTGVESITTVTFGLNSIEDITPVN